jgi:ubiquinone/menaquinone biosynthesis C-methylase UbiE
MSKVHSISDPGYVHTQYQNASNLNARIRLHQKFSTNPYRWQRWLFDQFRFLPQCHVLELACGAGSLWLDNLDRIPPGLDIILSDLSAGMVAQACSNLKDCPSFRQFAVIDVQFIPFPNECFDIVIANHMLYHLPNMGVALSEIKRVLTPGGRFYTSTIGQNHLKELSDLVIKFDPQLAAWGSISADSFTLENGSTAMEDNFSEVSLYRYIDSLVVKEVNPLVDYILSGRIEVETAQRLELENFVEQALQENGGKFRITKDSGVFEANNMIQAGSKGSNDHDKRY